MMRNRRAEAGLVSLVSTIIISLLLLIITTAMVYIMVGVERQATDADLSNRAYYAAESDAENAVLEIEQAVQSAATLGAAYTSLSVLYPGGCTTTPVNGTSGTRVVCRTVTFDTQEIRENAAREESNEYLIQASKNLARIVVDWNLPTDSSNLAYGGFGPAVSWNSPAVLEMLDVAYNPVSFTDVVPSTRVITPGGASSPAYNVGGGATENPRSQVVAGSCGVSVEYSCQATVNYAPPGVDRIIRIRPRYAGTHYRLRFYDTGGTLLTVRDSKATVDVTAQAGDVLRRVVLKTKIRAAVLSGLDYVLYSDTDICKYFDVDATTSTANAPGPFCS